MTTSTQKRISETEYEVTCIPGDDRVKRHVEKTKHGFWFYRKDKAMPVFFRTMKSLLENANDADRSYFKPEDNDIYELEIGDMVKIDSRMGGKTFQTVVAVHKGYTLTVWWKNNASQVKFSRVADGFFRSKGASADTWDTNTYTKYSRHFRPRRR